MDAVICIWRLFVEMLKKCDDSEWSFVRISVTGHSRQHKIWEQSKSNLDLYKSTLHDDDPKIN